MKLGTLLLRNAAISLSQLETALRSQILYGGRLGTNLIELGFVDVDALTGTLGELWGLPVATQLLLDSVTPSTLAMVNARTAEALGVIPLGNVPQFPDALAVAMIDPRDEPTIEELGKLTGHTIAPHVVSEARGLYYLERLYHLPRKARYIRPGTRRVLTAAVERRRTNPGAQAVPPPRIEARRVTGPVVIPPLPAPEPAITFGEATERLNDATHRDQIAAALLDYAVGRTAALLVFLVRDGNALGWRGYTLQPAGTAVTELSVPLGGASAFHAAVEEGSPFRGPPPAGHLTEPMLWSALGLSPAPEVIVAPIIVRNRPVNLVYAHPLPGGPFTDSVARELLTLCTRAADAYVRLIQRSKNA